jgi:hypothetical protein
LDLGGVEKKGRQLIIGEKVERETPLLKAIRPETADFRETGIHIALLVGDTHLACFQNAEAKEILDKVLQALTAGAHVAEYVTLAIVERS